MSGSIQKFGDITPQTAAVPVPQLFISGSTASICILAAGKFSPHLRNPQGKITLQFQWAKLPKLIASGAEQHMYGHKSGKLALKQEPEAVKRKHKSGDITPAQTAAVRVPQLFISGSTASICVPAAGKFRSSFEESSR